MIVNCSSEFVSNDDSHFDIIFGVNEASLVFVGRILRLVVIPFKVAFNCGQVDSYAQTHNDQGSQKADPGSLFPCD